MKHLIAIFALVLALPACSSSWKEDRNVGNFFERAKVTGTFVVYDVRTGKLTGYNRSRANQRLVPASTFKIPNSLIGLAVGAVDSVDEVLPYGGNPQPFEVWEDDMALRKAITLSNVPIYQELARRIGLEQMQQHVSLLGYGNEDIGDTVDTFWLEGPLAISAVEQAHFLGALATGTLPIRDEVQGSVREIVLLENAGGFRLFGKTGWENAPKPGVGWWVGWVETGDSIHSFALNIDIRQPSDAGKRLEIGKAALKHLGLLP